MTVKMTETFPTAKLVKSLRAAWGNPVAGLTCVLQGLMGGLRLFGLMLFSLPALGSNQWLTLQGDVDDPNTDSVQVAPETITVSEDLRTMQLRVSRSTLRNALDGGQYRSFQATAEINCADRTAFWRRHDYFMMPGWRGASRRFEHAQGKLPKIAFNSMKPNPVQRIVQAACGLKEIKNG